VRVTLGVVLTVVCSFYAALMFIVPFRTWERHDDFWVKVLVGLFVWGTGAAAFAYGGWYSVTSIVLGRKR
jgi:drug/metabolite transporter (DMT)-like permease